MDSFTLRGAGSLLDHGEMPSVSAARSAFLKRLPQDDFNPSPIQVASLFVLNESTTATPAIAGAMADQFAFWKNLLQTEIDSFRSAFWTMPTEGRRKRWDMLWRLSREHLCAQKQLRALETGLAIEMERYGELQGALREIASHLLDSFVTAVPRKATFRQKWLESKLNAPRAWASQAKHFRRTCPELERLDPSLTNELRGLPRLARERRRPSKLWQQLNRPFDEQRPLAQILMLFGFLAVCVVGVIYQSATSKSPRGSESPSLPRQESSADDAKVREAIVQSLRTKGISKPGPLVTIKDGVIVDAHGKPIVLRVTPNGIKAVDTKGNPVITPDIETLFDTFKKEHPDYPKGRPPNGFPSEGLLIRYGLIKPGQPFDK